MKKRIGILLLAAILLMLIPHAASANVPARNPFEITVYLKGVEKDTQVTACFAGEDGVFHNGETVAATGKDGQEVRFAFASGDTWFYLLLTAPNGGETRSDPVNIVTYGKYSYNASKNLLEEKTSYYNTKESCEIGGTLLLAILFLFFLPIAVTLLVEWLTALCFGVRPVKYVFAINAITNPIMNILLSITFPFGRIGYWITLIALEIAVVFIEYAFYRKKIPQISRRRLLLFSVTANVLSLTLGGLLQYFFM